MKLYAVTFGCFRCTVVASEPEKALDEALYGTKPFYFDGSMLGASIPPLIARHAFSVNEVEQRPYIKTLDKERASDSNSFAAACRTLGVSEARLREALATAYKETFEDKDTEIRTSAPASQEATNNSISKGEHKE